MFGHAASPYLALLKHAGCEMGDLRLLVAQRGLEGVSWARLLGSRLPYPTIVRLDEAIVVARWIHENLAKRGRAFLSSNVFHALRVALAASFRRSGNWKQRGDAKTPSSILTLDGAWSYRKGKGPTSGSARTPC